MTLTVKELISKTYLEDDQMVELFDYNIDENGGSDNMLPPMIWGIFTSRIAKKLEQNSSWDYYEDKNVVFFSFKDNKLHICIDYDNKEDLLNENHTHQNQ